MISGKSRVFALLGDPVAHSLSPVMQNAAFRVLGLDAAYVALRCAPADVAVAMRLLAGAGGGGNVTVPHKAGAAAALAAGTARVSSLGACNTFWHDGNALAGDNTDVDGVLAGLRELGAPATAWLVAGTGGSARAVVAAAVERGARIAVVSRDPARGAEFLAWARTLGATTAEPADCEVLINTTPLGLKPDDPPPLQSSVAPRATYALDMVYGRGQTRWARALRAQGIEARDGRTVLVAQGAAALERWFPGRRAPIEVMRAAVNDALR